MWHDVPRGAIPMVSLLGDNRVAKAHPEWVQTGPDGDVATRRSRYFDWDALCPSHPTVFEMALGWVDRAGQQSQTGRVRLDDVTFAREFFCQCQVCQRQAASRGLSWAEWRIERLSELVRAARALGYTLELTLFPDPFPGHLERRFGLDLSRLASDIDTFVVPIYDMHYATTYWLEVLAQAFQEILPARWFIELYGLTVPEEALVKAAQVAAFYADGVLIAYDNQLEKLQRIQERLKA